MAPAGTSVHVVEQAPHNGCCQGLCPQGEPQLPLASLRGLPRSAGGSDPGWFQITASALGPGAVRFGVCSVRVGSLFPTALQIS